jgi:KUP system potassium uptake protein
VFAVMTTWRRGREKLLESLRNSAVPLRPFLDSLFRDPPARVPNTAVFLTATLEVVPNALLHNLKHNGVLHERVVFLTVELKDVPFVPSDERASVETLGNNCWRVILYFGFMDRPDVSQALIGPCREHGLEFEMMRTSFFLSRESVIPAGRAGDLMASWRERLFVGMARNAGSAVEYFNIPDNRVIELGTRIQI